MDRTQLHDRVSFENARNIAHNLPQHPEWLTVARENLARWRGRNADAPGLLRCYYEWEAILQQPIDIIQRILTSESEESVRLRHNSPFTGILSPRTVWSIKNRLRNESIAT